jgi:hypothetical protein
LVKLGHAWTLLTSLRSLAGLNQRVQGYRHLVRISTKTNIMIPSIWYST